MVAAGWPSGLDDRGAAERLQAILIAASQNQQDQAVVDEYRTLRNLMIRREDLADAMPDYVRAGRELGSFWPYIKDISGQWAPRRDHIWKTFTPLFDRIEGVTKRPVASAAWTGRRSASQQARVVLTLGYEALIGVETLLDEQELPLHNGGPIDEVRADAIRRLKELHTAIGELIALAGEGASLEEQLAKVKQLGRRALRWSAEPIGLSLGSLPLVGMSTVIGVGVMQLVNVICPGQGTAFGVAALGAHATAAGVRAMKSDKQADGA